MSNIGTETRDEAEVFVLPPDLLEKLGINLCNIAHQSESKKEKKKTCKKTYLSNHEEILNNVSNSQDSSILETANLMKKSVFLSPTFVPMVADTIPGEVEISGNIQQPIDIYSTILQKNTELNTKDGCNNNNQVNFVFDPCPDTQNNSFLGLKQSMKSRMLKETESEEICNGIGRTNIQSPATSEINMKNFLNLGDVKSKLKLKCLQASTSIIKNDIQSLKVSKGNLQNSHPVCHTNTNNHETVNEKQCVVATLDDIDCRLEKDPLVIPVSMQFDKKSSLNHNGIADHSHNIIHNHNSVNYHNYPQNNDLSVLSNQPKDYVANGVNGDMIKYTGSENVDTELDNILQETEILVPILSTTVSSNMSANVVVDIVDEEINKPHINLIHDKDLHNNVKNNDVLVSVSSELTNISNITQNMNDTQNIDILYESFDCTSNEIEIANINQQQKSVVQSTYACESEQQSKGIDIDIINHIDCDETSDMELDNMLRETEILIFSPSNTSIPVKDKLLKHDSEVNDVIKRNETINPMVDFNKFGENDNTNTNLSNSSLVIEAKCRNIIINHNGLVKKVKNYDTDNFPQNRHTASVSSFHSDHISAPRHTEENIIDDNDKDTVNILANKIIHEYSDGHLYKSTEQIFYANELKLEQGSDVVVVNNNFMNSIEANISKINLEDLSNKVTIPNGNEADKMMSMNNKQTENNNIYHTPRERISSNQYNKLKQNVDSLDMSAETGQANNLDVSCIQTEKNETSFEDKVQEIAKYLKEVYQNKKRLVNPKVEILTKSKIFIQGVEKPGGTREQELVLNKFKLHKTYEKKKRMQSNVAPTIEEISDKITKIPEENSTVISTCIKPSLFTNPQEFCLCGDFGKLPDVYEFNNLYVHIHFGSNVSVNCPIDYVFGIYYERPSLNSFENREYVPEEELNNESDSGHICWQKFEFQEDEDLSLNNKQLKDVEAVDEKNLKTDLTLVPTSAIKHSKKDDEFKQRKSPSRSKLNITNIQENDANFDSEVSNQNEILAYLVIEDNAVASQLDTDVKEHENALLLAQTDAEKDYQHNKTETKQEFKKNLFDHEVHSEEPVLDYTANISETVEKIGENAKSRKRKIKNDIEEPPAKKNVKCGVCEQMIAESEWEDHISKVHYYIAWREGHSIDFENLLLLKKIKKKLQNKGSLICTFCGYEYVQLMKFLSHVKKCFTKKMSKYNIDGKQQIEVASTSKSELSICGVCQLEVSDLKWIEHISEKHQYLAWKKGESPLDLEDENKVKDHLLKIVKKHGHLICVKCGLVRKYTAKSIKNYLTHIENCTVKCPSETRNSRRFNNSEQSLQESACTEPAIYKCAVCEKDIEASEWWDHASQHNYRTWIHGDAAPNFEDDNELWEHLNKITKKEGGLRCSKCGLVRKYAKAYLQHIGSCTTKENETVVGSTTNIIEESQVVAASSDIVNSIDSPKMNTKISRHNMASTDIISNKDKEKIEAVMLNSDTVDSIDEKLNKVTCGVCNMAVEESKWIDHIRMEHNYIAWRAGETPLDSYDKKAIHQHLYNIVSSTGKLICPKCGKGRKFAKNFLKHLKNCCGLVESSTDTSKETTECSVLSHVDRFLKSKDLDESVTELKCGVCQEVTARDAWIAHIQTAHDYIAWIDGETPLDTNNQDMIREHLQKIVDEIGALICAKCGISRKYAKKFLQHLQKCSQENQAEKQNIELKPYEVSTCGVCAQKVQINQWMSHIRLVHNYIAWKDTEAVRKNPTPVQIEKRLRAILDKVKEVACPKCGYKSKEVEQYLQHSESCAGNPVYDLEDKSEAMELARKGFYQCGMCQEKVKYGEWKNHAVDKHYNVAWVVGDEPIDLFNQHVITKVLTEYLKFGRFVCKVCGISRSSASGFYAHFVLCGLTEEEADKYRLACDECGMKYLGIYKSQHMAWHTQQMLAQERKEKAVEDRERERARKLEALASVSGPRRAAQKAKMVIEETVRQSKHVCQSCGFATDVKEELTTHKCAKRRRISADVDLSLEQENSSDEQDLDSDVNESNDDYVEGDDDDDEECESKPGRKKHSEHSASARVTRIPFEISNVSDYLSKSAEDFAEHYFTTDTLFPQWTQCNYQVVPESEILETVPPLEDSCQVFSNGKWKSYKRWQAVKDKEKCTMFVGYNIQRVSWVPEGARLAVAGHAAPDRAPLGVRDLRAHTTLIQIWDFEEFKTTPKLVMGLVIPFGTVWAMDWCPSGAQECLKAEDEGFVRMGLLAIACSNGFAYILSVPYPSTVTSDSIFYKLEPVAQLKFAMKSDKPKYQATSICWSKQKGHSIVIVGYSDGLTAYYDLNTESPFLKAKEKDVTIFYPFCDERVHNGCITGLDSFPIARGGSAVGALCASSPTGGAVLSAGAAGRAARLRSNLASAGAGFLPGWPSALLAGDDVVMMLSVSELEYWGVGRRACGAQARAACARCGLGAAHVAPWLRTMRLHHAHRGLNKKAVAWIGARQLGKKRKRNEDKNEARTESLKYEDTIKNYGIEFKLVSGSTTQDAYNSKELSPERFPLWEAAALAFCPAPRHHARLAFATHSGIIFVFKV